MNILLVNDDGYAAEGINLLKKKLDKYGRVVMVAPEGAMSAKSVSITFGRAQKLRKIDTDIYAFDGLPTDCASFGLSNLSKDLGIEFDLVVSGCNHGWNICHDVMYSGTVGALTMALTYHKKVMAISCEMNFDIVDKYFDKVFDYILKNNLLSSEYITNVNFPLGDEVKDIRIGKLFDREQQTFYVLKEDGYYADRIVQECENVPEDTDFFQVNHGIVSIVPLAKTTFNEEIYNKLK